MWPRKMLFLFQMSRTPWIVFAVLVTLLPLISFPVTGNLVLQTELKSVLLLVPAACCFSLPACRSDCQMHHLPFAVWCTLFCSDLLYIQCLCYLDDIIIFADSPEQLIERLDNVFNRLCHNGLKAKPSKCVLFKLSLIHIWRCRRIERCRSRWSPYH